MNNPEVIILFSGGMDSTILLRLAPKVGLNPYCILINYGQKHIQELEFAEEQCKKMFINYQVIDIDLDISSKLTNGVEQYKNVSPWHVPSRNLMFISFAAAVAESRGTNLIWYGANYEDRTNLFPDCYQEWVYQLNKLLEINGSFKITVEAPLLGMTKETIKKLKQSYNIKDEEIFSGYGQ